MNGRQIECFLEAASLLNFTKAAESLTLPQPAVSRYISSLEEELGVSLFHRENNRRMTLTEEGKIYYNFFRRFALEYTHTRNLLSGGGPQLRLGYNTGWNLSDILPNVFQRCREAHPDFRIHLECLDFSELVEGLREKRLDAVISMENYLNQETDLETERLIAIRRYVIYSDHLDGHENLKTPADLYPYSFFIADDSRIRQICHEAETVFQPYHFVPHFVAVRNLDTVFACVENGLGVALLDEWYGNLNGHGVHSMYMNESISIALAKRKHSGNPSVEILQSALAEELRQSGKSPA